MVDGNRVLVIASEYAHYAAGYGVLVDLLGGVVGGDIAQGSERCLPGEAYGTS